MQQQNKSILSRFYRTPPRFRFAMVKPSGARVKQCQNRDGVIERVVKNMQYDTVVQQKSENNESITYPLQMTSNVKNFVQPINLNIKKIKSIKLNINSDLKNVKQIKDYIQLNRNIYVDMKPPSRLAQQKWPECESCNGAIHCCLGCEMYIADIECHINAHGNIDCGNQRIQRKQFAKTIVKSAGARGKGLFCAQKSIRIGSLITEYVGEIISEDTLFKRLNGQHFYGVFLGKFKNHEGQKVNFYIDSTFKGNTARFANHSCDPNAEARFVYIGNEKRVGLFAIKQIKEGDEITFDYRLETVSENPVVCLCGADNCTGFIGKKKL